MEKKKAEPAPSGKKQPDAASAPDGDVSSSASGYGDGRIMLGEDIEIYPSRPLDNPSSPGVQAFEAKDRRLVGGQIALLCGRSAVPRVTNIGSYRGLRDTSILHLVDSGVVDWPVEGSQRFAFIFERPPGRRLMDSLDGVPHRFSEDRIISGLVEPVLQTLSTLCNIELVHGAINPMNIYLSGGDNAESVILGECLTSAPSFRQHVMFEPIERAMAMPSGRGPGTAKDDLYAFGMCVLFALRGENLIAGRTEEEIIYAKLDEGSYTLAVGGARLPGGLSEFLRGVLSDDETQRWDIDDAMRWIEGRRLSAKQPRPILSAARPFIFKGKKYWDLRALAEVFSHNVDEAVRSIEQDQFDLWLKRNFEDKDMIKRLEDVWEAGKTADRDKFMTNVCMALDPVAPVRYKGVSLFPSGFGNALATAMAEEKDIQVYGEIITQQFFSTWINYRFEEIYDAGMQLGQLEKCRNYLTQKMAGYGLERVLYTLNKECVCMSPMLKDYFVLGVGRLLLALDGLARRGVRPEQVLDRHMIAFISVREQKMIDPWLGHIISREKGNQVVGYIRTLAAIQRRFNISSIGAVTAWMSGLCAPVVDRFKDKDLRREVTRQLDHIRETENLAGLLELIDDPLVVEEDSARFLKAQKEFIALSQEKARIERHLKQRRSFGRATGRQVAMLVSAVVATLCILGYMSYLFTQRVF